MTQNKIEIHFTDKDHVWINGRQYISLGRVGQMLSEKHKTNADKIRAMTDEELAECLFRHICNWSCPPAKEYTKASCGGEKPDCAKCWLDWLKQEADT